MAKTKEENKIKKLKEELKNRESIIEELNAEIKNRDGRIITFNLVSFIAFLVTIASSLGVICYIDSSLVTDIFLFLGISCVATMSLHVVCTAYIFAFEGRQDIEYDDAALLHIMIDIVGLPIIMAFSVLAMVVF